MTGLPEYGPAMIATTAAITQLITAADASLTVTTRMPTAARVGVSGPSTNLFLYSDELLEMRLTDITGAVYFHSLGEKLNYLVTAFAPDDTDTALLAFGVARTAIANTPVLNVTLPSGATRRVELRPTTLPLVDLTALWIAADAPLRLSFTFEAVLQPVDAQPQRIWPALTEAVSQASRGTIIELTGADASSKAAAVASTLAAANQNVMRVALTDIVSAVADATEKNLTALFERAEQDGAVLLFDEADAIFGKRSEVRDAHDKYANVDTSYLLQRIEQHRGTVILATSEETVLLREHGAVIVRFPPN